MVTIRLRQIIFHAYHGVYSGEPLVGGDFELNLQASYDDAGISFENLNDTISYVSLLDIAKQRMSKPTPLLEKICKDILDEIGVKYPSVQHAEISLFKLQAPIISLQGSVGVTLTRVY